MYFPPNFDVARSLELAQLVTQAYVQLDAFEKGIPWTLQGGYTLVRQLVQETGPGTLARNRTQYGSDLRFLRSAALARNRSYPIGFIAQKGGESFIAFRGTITVSEWIRNLNVRLSEYAWGCPGRIHDGFMETYAIVRATLREALATMDPKNRLYVTGHSLGAALATLSVPDIASTMQFTRPVIYTFGSPRVGDGRFCASFNERFANDSFRIVNTSDIVVSVPLPAPVFGVIGGYFSHVEKPVDFTVQADDLEKNHAMETYRSALLSTQGGKWSLRKMFGRRIAKEV